MNDSCGNISRADTVHCHSQLVSLLSAWDELLEEFRALGGTAQNIRLGVGEYGRGLFPIDSAKPVHVHVPDNLLPGVEDIVMQNGVPRIGPNAKANGRERAWLNRYLEEFAWGPGGVDEIHRKFEMAGQLPQELRNRLTTQYRCGRWFEEPSERLIAIQFFTARSIAINGRPTIMPIVDLANHGQGPSYDLSGGVTLHGSFAGEIVTNYAEHDSYDYFVTWGFATQRPLAFSVRLAGSIDATAMEIGDAFEDTCPPPMVWVPQIDRTDSKVRLPFLLIGHRQSPRMPKGIFYRSMRDKGFKNVEETFDLIHHSNRLHFVNLLIDLEGIDVPIAHSLRTMAQYQLRAMSFCYGA